ncbi:MAG: nucleotide exchange factor GrpE [Alphaproteobacteria bacterium]
MNEQAREKTGHEADPARRRDEDTGAAPEEEQPEETTRAAARTAAEVASEKDEEGAAELPPEEQLAQMKDRLLRAMAEAENIRRRSERERAEAQKFGIARFARDLLSVADNLRRAIDAVPEEQRGEMDEAARNLVTGVEMVERELLATFERHGVTPLQPEKGAKFDPNLHQAMAEVPDPDAPPGTVVDVYQTGYVIGDRLLRPAMVTVAKAGGAEPGKTEPAASEAARDPGPES